MYEAPPGYACRPAIDPMKRMCPSSRMCGSTSRVMRRTPSTFVWTTRASSSAVDSVNGARPSARPALLKRMSTPPSSATAASTNAADAGLVGDVDLERDVGLDPLDPPRTPRHAHARLAQLAHGRGADPGGGAGDDRGLAVQVHVHARKGRGFSLNADRRSSGLGGEAEASHTELDAVDRDRRRRAVAAVAVDERDPVDDVLAAR